MIPNLSKLAQKTKAVSSFGSVSKGHSFQNLFIIILGKKAVIFIFGIFLGILVDGLIGFWMNFVDF